MSSKSSSSDVSVYNNYTDRVTFYYIDYKVADSGGFENNTIRSGERGVAANLAPHPLLKFLDPPL